MRTLPLIVTTWLGSARVAWRRSSASTGSICGARAPVPGTGWGCVVCRQPNDGAMAIVCDECLAGKRPYQFAIRGFAADRQRIPIGELAGSFGHNLDYHRDEPDVGFTNIPDWATRAGPSPTWDSRAAV